MSSTASGGGMPPLMNKTMKFVLRSPLHGIISSYILLITFTGRKSGKTYTTPVSYYRADDQVAIFTHANWWKNLRSDTPITLRVRGRDYRVIAEAVAEDKSAIAEVLAEHLTKSHFDAKFYNVTYDEQGNPKPEEVEKAVETVVMIRAQLN
jgi:deazaflavin-dependent oxidoreductase (nitroreductase family)